MTGEAAGAGGRRVRRPHRRFRRDIEGLRAVAVLAVVLYHAGFGWIPGGYVGVDVFYVISGYLITDLLWRETEASRRLEFLAFYARRARRLLPAAILVLVVTIAVSGLVLPPLEMRSVWKDGLWCALYVGNFRFAADRTNYLADTSPSPFQHYWSLGVEEQFYLVWPLVLLVVSLAVWRRPSRGWALGGLAAVTVLSFWASITLTRSDQPVAFFLLPSRAWELGLGGLVALAGPHLGRLGEVAAAVIGWAGLVAILLACAAYGSTTAYPGDAAALPVVGAAAVIVGGAVHSQYGPVMLLRQAVPRAFGRISYSLYLWHYPVLVLVPVAVGRSLSPLGRLGLVGLSSVLAAMTFRFVEVPGQRARWWAASPLRSLRLGFAASLAGVVACVLVGSTTPSLRGHGQAPVATLHGGVRSVPGTAGPSPRSGPPTTVADPLLATIASQVSQVAAAVAASAGTTAVPANLNPPLGSAPASEAPPLVDGCLMSYTATEADRGCVFGDTTSTKSIVLFGDSHAGMWFPAVDSYATANGYRLDVWLKAACPPVDITIFSPVLGRTWTECHEWYQNSIAAIKAARPALVVVGIAPNYDPSYDVVQNGPAWLSGLTSTISSAHQAGAAVLVIGSVPSPPIQVPDCLSAHLDSVSTCDFSPVGRHVGGGGLVGIDTAGEAAEASTVRADGATYADVSPWFCTASVCDVIVDNLLVYRDNSHVTVPYADYLAPLIGNEMLLASSR